MNRKSIAFYLIVLGCNDNTKILDNCMAFVCLVNSKEEGTLILFHFTNITLRFQCLLLVLPS